MNFINHSFAYLRRTACINWDTTVKVLDELRAGVQARRKLRPQTNGSHNASAESLLTGTTSQKDFNDLSSLSVGQNAL